MLVPFQSIPMVGYLYLYEKSYFVRAPFQCIPMVGAANQALHCDQTSEWGIGLLLRQMRNQEEEEESLQGTGRQV